MTVLTVLVLVVYWSNLDTAVMLPVLPPEAPVVKDHHNCSDVSPLSPRAGPGPGHGLR